MSATYELRRLLDERGVEHYDGTESTIWGKEGRVYRFSASERAGGYMSVHMWCDTPEQAVEATLGRGTCRLVRHGNLADHDYIACWSCSECSFGWHHSIYDKQFSYCPNCGRKVVE